VYEQIARNKRRTFAILAAFVGLIALVALALTVLLSAGWIGLVIAVVVAGGLAFFSYFESDKIALAASRAKPADEGEYRRYHNLVEGLCIAAGLPKPRLYVVDDPAPNAFATGRNPEHAAIAVTTGLLEKMNRVELEGVLAHELSHIKNYDILVTTVAVVAVGAIALVADIGLRFAFWGGMRDRRDSNDSPLGGIIAILALALIVLAPFAGYLMQFAMSRNREYLADASGVQLTRYPPGLISALEKLRDDSTVVHATSHATAHMWIEEPAAQTPAEGRLARFNRLFDTHPPIEERIALLREM
jgi:heat shock protein HtpX